MTIPDSIAYIDFSQLEPYPLDDFDYKFRFKKWDLFVYYEVRGDKKNLELKNNNVATGVVVEEKGGHITRMGVVPDEKSTLLEINTLFVEKSGKMPMIGKTKKDVKSFPVYKVTNFPAQFVIMGVSRSKKK